MLYLSSCIILDFFYFVFARATLIIMPPPHRVEGLSDAFVWRLSVCHVHLA